MRDITDLMNAYRECLRHLWNAYFLGRENIGGSLDVYSRIQPLLFEGLIENELTYDGEADPDTLPPVLKICPETTALILIKRLSNPGEGGYWDAVKDLLVGPDDIELEFVDYFDFDEVRIRDFRYCLCRIQSFPSHPQFQGRESLIEAQGVRILHDESK